MGRAGLAAILAALVGLAVACAKPTPNHPVRTEAEAIAMARDALAKTGYGQSALAAERNGSTWVVTTPRQYKGSDWGQMIVSIDSATGKSVVSSFQTATVDVDL